MFYTQFCQVKYFGVMFLFDLQLCGYNHFRVVGNSFSFRDLIIKIRPLIK